jgi:hypothetical protein
MQRAYACPYADVCWRMLTYAARAYVSIQHHESRLRPTSAKDAAYSVTSHVVYSITSHESRGGVSFSLYKKKSCIQHHESGLRRTSAKVLAFNIKSDANRSDANRMLAYVSIRHHTSAYVCIRMHTYAQMPTVCVLIDANVLQEVCVYRGQKE